ncbi:MAG: phage portal protein [Pseudomonadota bacterium]
MLERLKQALGLSKRSLDAAGGGRRWADDRRINSVGDLHREAATISARATHFALNTPTGSRIIDSLTANLVGAGIVPRSEHPTERTRQRLQVAFKAWTDKADADGRSDFYGLQAHAVRDLVTHGEFLFNVVVSEDQTPRLRRLHPDQLDRSYTRNTATSIIHQGVELDRDGRVSAYWIRPDLQGVALAGVSITPVRIPASDIIHGFRQLVPGQLRGISWFAPVLLAAKELDALADAMLVRAKVAALHAGFVRDARGETPYTGTQTQTELNAGLEPGALIVLPEGKDVELPAVPDQGGANELMMASYRLIAAGVGVPYAAATGDYSQANYSSERASQLEYRRFLEMVQHHVLVFLFCRPVWARFIRWQVLQGTITARSYLTDRSAVQAVKWLPPAWPWVDPQKDLKAVETELSLGLSSRAQKVAERGYDIEDVDRERAADQARSLELGLAPQVELAVAPSDPVSDDDEVNRTRDAAATIVRAAFRPSTANDDDRTVDLVASAGADVPRMDFDGPYLERLVVSKDAVDLSRLDGMPLLDTHRQDGLERVLGVVLSARVQRGKILVSVQVSQRHTAIWEDIRSGIIGNVSVGYVALQWQDKDDPRTGVRVRTVTKWELREVSLVPVGADPAGKVRSGKEAA